MPSFSTDFQIGDHIKKVIDKITIDDMIFKITNLKKINGGDWHDGYTVTYIATIVPIDAAIMAAAVEDYCIQYTNYMCQIKNIFAIKV